MTESDFNEMFPKGEVGEVKLQKNINNWRCPDRLWATLDAFKEEWPECIPKGSESVLYKKTMELLEEIGELAGPRFIRWASQIIRHEKPQLISSVKTPGTFIFLVPEFRRTKGGEVCPECGQSDHECPHDWGSRRRHEKYFAGLE